MNPVDPHYPALPVETEHDPARVVVNKQTGETRQHWHLIYSERDTERIRLGYCCMQCGESQVDHGAPFPERCWVCGFPIRDAQPKRFQDEFEGTTRLGPQTTVEEELEYADELLAPRKGGIIVPRSVTS